VLALGMLVAEACLWTLVHLPHPYVADEQRDRQVVAHLRGAPPNRYLPSYHVPAVIRIDTDGVALPGVHGAGTFTINRFGFRSPRLDAIDKPPGVRRVFCVGGSTTECLYLDDADAWPERLQAELALPGLDVVNAGHSGDATRDHLALMAQRITAFAPDVVLFLVGINDFMQQQAPDYSLMRDDARSLAGREAAAATHWKVALCDASQTARAIVLIGRRLTRGDSAGRVEQDVHGGWVARERAKWRALPWSELPDRAPGPEFALNLRSLVGICRAHGAVSVLLTQPALWDSDDRRCEARFWRRVGNRRVPDRALWQAIEDYNDVTRAVARELDVPLVDLARLMPKSVDLFYDDDHVNVAGANVMARLVADGLRADARVAARLAPATTRDASK
jgi:lysophospholipase L1-like esterase